MTDTSSDSDVEDDDGRLPSATGFAKRPELTLPPEAADALRGAYGAAQVILEYGSGGSTLAAAEMPGKTIFSVESDRAWSENMEAWFRSNPGRSPVCMHHVDVGRTAAWGRPADTSGFRNWPNYPLSVWKRPDFRHPDAVLIDGRFRTACFFATVLQITRPVTLLFDDYAGRRYRRRIERLAKPTRFAGRMAIFDLAPHSFPTADMAMIIESFLDPF